MNRHGVSEESKRFVERRMHPRRAVDILVSLIGSTHHSCDEPIAGQATEISLEGLRLAIAFDVPEGCTIVLQLNYLENDSVCVGEVKWKSRDGANCIYGVHIKKWSYLDPDLKYLVAKHTFRASRTRPAPLLASPYSLFPPLT